MRASTSLLLCLLAVASVGAVHQPAGHYVRTPGGEVWSTCLHRVPSGTDVADEGEVTMLTYPDGSKKALQRCPMPVRRTIRPSPKAKAPASGSSPLPGWQVWTTYQHVNNDTFTTFLGNFSVPPVPTQWPASDDAILYMFTGLQSDNWVPIAGEPSPPATFDIIQPVLQYGGGSENGGGKYWGVASWYVTINDGALWSNELQLKPGNVIFGNMTMLSPSKWFIGSTANGQTTSISVSKPRLITQPWAYCTLEVYNIGSCSWFPPSGSSIKFTTMSLTDQNGPVTPTWTVNSNGAGHHCSAAVSLGSDSSSLSITF